MLISFLLLRPNTLQEKKNLNKGVFIMIEVLREYQSIIVEKKKRQEKQHVAMAHEAGEI